MFLCCKICLLYNRVLFESYQFLGQCRDHSILGLFFNLITILSKQINRGFIYSSIYHNLNRYNVMCNFPFIGHSKYEIFLTWYVYNIWKTNLIFHIFSIAYFSIQIKHTVLLKLTMWRKSMYMYMYWCDSWHISVEEFTFISFYLKNYLKYFILIKIISSWDQFCWDINFLSRGCFSLSTDKMTGT